MVYIRVVADCCRLVFPSICWLTDCINGLIGLGRDILKDFFLQGKFLVNHGLAKHFSNMHINSCEECGQAFTSLDKLQLHKKNCLQWPHDCKSLLIFCKICMIG